MSKSNDNPQIFDAELLPHQNPQEPEDQADQLNQRALQLLNLDPQKSTFAIDGDDSSDDEEIMRKLEKSAEEKWKEFAATYSGGAFISDLEEQGLSKDQIKQSFLLHHAGIAEIYGDDVAEIYYTKKEKHFKKLDEVKYQEKIKKIILENIGKAIENLCEIAHRRSLKTEEINKIKKQILDKSQSEIENIVKIIIQKRALGIRVDKVQELLESSEIKGEINKIAQRFNIDQKDIREPQAIPAVGLDQNLQQKAAEVARQELSDIDFEGTQLLDGNKSPSVKFKKDNPNIDFSDLTFKKTLTQAWKFLLSVRSNEKPSFKTVEIAKAYLEDLIEMDKASGVASDAWPVALEYKEVMKLLPLDRAKIISKFVVDFTNLVAEELAKSTQKIERPTLPESYEFKSDNPLQFLANLRLSNRSLLRTARNFADFEKKPDGETFYRQWKFGDNSKPALERQQINTALSRVDMVDNAGSYRDIYSSIEQLKQKHSIDDKVLAIWFRQILNGQNISSKKPLDNVDKKNLVNITYLMFGVENARNPISFIAGFMILDLIEAGKLTFKDAIYSKEHKTRYGGGYFPMSIAKMPLQPAANPISNPNDSESDFNDSQESIELKTPTSKSSAQLKTPDSKSSAEPKTPTSKLSTSSNFVLPKTQTQDDETKSLSSSSTKSKNKRSKQDLLDQYDQNLLTNKGDGSEEDIDSFFDENNKLVDFDKNDLPDFIKLLFRGEERYCKIDKHKDKKSIQSTLNDLHRIHKSKMISGAPVESARKLHSQYGDFMPHFYQYLGGEASDKKVGLEKTAELVKREAEIVKLWTDEIGQDLSGESLSQKIDAAKAKWYGVANQEEDNSNNSPSPSFIRREAVHKLKTPPEVSKSQG